MQRVICGVPDCEDCPRRDYPAHWDDYLGDCQVCVPARLAGGRDDCRVVCQDAHGVVAEEGHCRDMGHRRKGRSTRCMN